MRHTRRTFLCRGGLAGAGLAVSANAYAQLPRAQADGDYVARGGPIRHSVMGWCFKPMKPQELARHCAAMGMTGIEGISRDAYKDVMKLGLKISLVSGGHGFRNGPCNPDHHDRVVAGLRDGIELAAEIGTQCVITFTGMRYEGMDDEEAADRCVATWKEVLSLAEQKGVTLVLEHLNSRDDTHPMKGHPGYFGDDVDFCFDLVKRVGSENFKLLFDIYHVAIMNGDIIRRIRENKQYIGHYHTAGNPGRGELDDTQEINYPAIMREIARTGFDGFVAHEFIPTWDDPMASLRHGVQVCDVAPSRPAEAQR
jgi:hydroxypyruvate isomerase